MVDDRLVQQLGRPKSAPRLFHCPDDPEAHFALPRDPTRSGILANILADCEHFARRRPWRRLAERPHSPHPFHQLYITFYSAMQATALIEHYAFAWRLTRDPRWLRQARRWLLAASAWQHGDRIEEHFYTANRYLHAFAFALDLLDDCLTDTELRQVTDCLIALLQRWWPEVDDNRRNPAGGHHPVVDNAHFGVAALYLLGKHPDASAWVDAVIDRFRAAIMTNGCGPAGEPIDGATFWPWENMWLLQFADALRNVTGQDLYAEFPRRLRLPLQWFRHHLVRPDLNLGAGARPAWSTTLLRLSQEAGDAELRNLALADETLGRTYRFGIGVKGSTAECMIAYGPYAYLYVDPNFQPRSRPTHVAPSRVFSGVNRSAVLRSSWRRRALVAQVSGYDGRLASGFSNLQVCWNGHPILKALACSEAQPVACGSLPCVGGQNEFVARLQGLTRSGEWDRLRVHSPRVTIEYWLRHGDEPILLVGMRRRQRTLKLVPRGRTPCVKLSGNDYLQYAREPYFNPDAGEVRLRFRLREEISGGRPRILWNAGIGVAGQSGTQVNLFSLGFFGGDGLVFAVQSQRYTCVEVRLPPAAAAVRRGAWHEVAARWGGFNDAHGRPFIEVELDGCRRRCDDVAAFGELRRDSQGLHSRASARTFYIRPNTVLAFGGAAQAPGTGTRCDIARISVTCAGRQPLLVDAANGLGDESGGGPLVWKLNPEALQALRPGRLQLAAGRQLVDVLPAYPGDISLAEEDVAFAPSGLAAGSLKRFQPQAEQDGSRVLISAVADCLILALAPRSSRARVDYADGRLTVRTKSAVCYFAMAGRGPGVLVRR